MYTGASKENVGEGRREVEKERCLRDEFGEAGENASKILALATK
jgi:hypothetical protein